MTSLVNLVPKNNAKGATTKIPHNKLGRPTNFVRGSYLVALLLPKMHHLGLFARLGTRQVRDQKNIGELATGGKILFGSPAFLA